MFTLDSCSVYAESVVLVLVRWITFLCYRVPIDAWQTWKVLSKQRLKHNTCTTVQQCCLHAAHIIWLNSKVTPMFVLSHLPKSSIKSSLSPLQTAWTGFDPYLNSGGSFSARLALVEIAAARSFILNRGIVTDAMSATPLEPGWWAVHSIPLHQGSRCQPGQCPADWLACPSHWHTFFSNSRVAHMQEILTHTWPIFAFLCTCCAHVLMCYTYVQPTRMYMHSAAVGFCKGVHWFARSFVLNLEMHLTAHSEQLLQYGECG